MRLIATVDSYWLAVVAAFGRLLERLHIDPAVPVLVAVSALLRLPTLGSENLWYDESFTDWMVRLDLPHLFQALRGDVHPPGWYLVEWFNIRIFGDSEFALRLPSALLGILAVYLIWRLALAIDFDRRTAFLAGLIAVLLPAALYYSQDARMYPLLTCSVLLAIWAALREKWPLFVLAGVGAVYAQNLGLVYMAAIGVVVLLSRWRQKQAITAPIVASAMIGLAWLPWLPSFLHQITLVQSGFWLQAPNVGTAFWPLMAMTMGTRAGDQFQIHIYLAAIALSFIGLIASRRWLMTRSGVLILSGALLMPLIALAVSIVWKPIYLHRALLPSAMLFVLFWAYALTHLKPTNRAVAMAVLLPMLVVGDVAHYFPAQGGRGSFPDFVEPIVKGWQPGDVIDYLAIDATILTKYYLRDYPYALFPEASDLNQSLTQETKDAMGIVQASFESLWTKGYRRVWIVAGVNPLSSQGELDELERLKALGAVLIKHEGTDYVSAYIYRMDHAPEPAQTTF